MPNSLSIMVVEADRGRAMQTVDSLREAGDYDIQAMVGLDWVRERILDPATRAGLIERFDLSQSVYQRDPWADHVQTRRAAYAPTADLSLEAVE